MSSFRTRTKTIRISNEAADYFEGKPLNRIVEDLYTLMSSGKAKYDGELRVDSCKTYALSESVYTELDSMKTFFGGSMDAMLEEFVHCLIDGTIQMHDGKYRVNDPVYERFCDACRDRGLDKDKVLKEVIKGL